MKSNMINTVKITKHIVDWLTLYAKNAKVKGFVVGISGGIDSAVVSTLCARTGMPTYCIELPIHQPASHVSRAKEHITFLQSEYKNVKHHQADLTQSFETLIKDLPISENPKVSHLTYANTRARLRMTSLYYFAGIHHALVVGTGNKIEDFGVGFFTKYGDGGVDISPIADLMKSEVSALAKHLGVPTSIIDANPADGLFDDDRSDEDQLGASYDELEEAMIAHQNGMQDKDFNGREKEVFKIYSHLNAINQHKINPIPVCIIPEDLKHQL